MYAIPLRLEMENGKKKPFFNKGGYLQLSKSTEAYKQRINAYVCRAQSNVNALAVLCGISDVFLLDVDAEGKEATETNAGKEAGTELWEELINKHGDIVTLKARTGSGNGLHYFFSASKTEGLLNPLNFSTIYHEGTTWAIDGRGSNAGLAFVSPSSYQDNKGRTFGYSWIEGDETTPRVAMPPWLVRFLNDTSAKAVGSTTGNVEVKQEPQQLEYENRPISSPNNQYTQAEESTGGSDLNMDSLLPGLQPALTAIREMLQKVLPGDQSRFNGVGMRTQTGWQVLKFKTIGTRTCLNGCEHVSNNFSILCNGGILLYRCLSSECIKRLACLLGIYYWPECLPLRADAAMIRECERYLVPRSDETKKLSKEEAAERKKRKNDMYNLLIKVMNAYFAVVIGGNKTVYTEIVYCRDKDGNLQREEVIERPGHNFIERCRNIQLDCLHGKNKEVARFWESNSKRREYDRIVFEPDPSRVTSRHFNLFCGLEFEPLLQKLEPSEMADCELQMPKLMWHIRAIISDGCETRFAYNIKWMAHAVQRPGKKIGVAWVLRGPQGCGKSILADFLGMRIIGGKKLLILQ